MGKLRPGGGACGVPRGPVTLCLSRPRCSRLPGRQCLTFTRRWTGSRRCSGRPRRARSEWRLRSPPPQVRGRRAGGVLGAGVRASTRSPEDSVRQFTPRLPNPEAQASHLSQGHAVLPRATPRSARAIHHLLRPLPLLESQASLDRSSSGRQSLPSRLDGQSLVPQRCSLQWARDSVKAGMGAKQARILPLTHVCTHAQPVHARA